jgi:BASS family bile acid:Na+ symporter
MSWLTFVVARLMPVWILVFAAIALSLPQTFASWNQVSGIAIGFVLFLMGLTLDCSRLLALLIRPLPPLLGSLGKWILAPLVSVFLARLFFAHSPLASGIIMAGIVPSGTSANLNSLIAGGDLALSVTMSALDTLVGPLLTPALAKWLSGSYVHLEYLPFLWKMTRIVFFPLLIGIGLQYGFPSLNRRIRPYAPLLSSCALYVVVLGIVANAGETLLANTPLLLPLAVCVFLQVGLQMVLGYMYAKLVRYEEAACRSVLFEVGICNAALAAVLAYDTFGPLAGVAAMANMVCNLTMGSLVAAILSSRSPAASKVQKTHEIPNHHN